MRKHTTPEVYAELLRGLGPWANVEAHPGNVRRREVTIAPVRPDQRSFEAWIYEPSHRQPSGALVVCPGLHYAGPSDPRLIRFLEVLASAGILVLSPFLPDFTALVVDPRVSDDLDRTFEALLNDPARPPEVRPGIFSISFGSLPALTVAASERRRDQVGAVVVFGGYADFIDTVRFSLGVDAHGQPLAQKRDPLNQPVVFMNLAEEMIEDATDRALLLAAWKSYVMATWGRPELKVRARYEPIARATEATLPEHLRTLFRAGCGLEPDTFALCEPAMARAAKRVRFIDPRPGLSTLKCPVYLCHGMDDDVIPHSELEALARAMPAGATFEKHLTGLYGHTGSASFATSLKEAPLLLREARTLLGILHALVRASRAR